MLPTTFEFQWDAGHMIFFGLFYAVVVVVFTSLSYVVIKSIVDVWRGVVRSRDEADHATPTHESVEHAGGATAKT